MIATEVRPSILETAAIIPAFNEAERVGRVVRAALVASEVDLVLVADDGSTDDTRYAACRAFDEYRQHNHDQGLDIKPHGLVIAEQNQGKTAALRMGIEKAKELGGTTLHTLVFLDADSSPMWTRDSRENMKLWQRMIQDVFHRPEKGPGPEDLAEYEEAFNLSLG